MARGQRAAMVGSWVTITIVLADEPTGYLDSVSGAALIELLEELHTQGATILVITHDNAVAARLPRQVQMLDGQIVADTSQGVLEGAGL